MKDQGRHEGASILVGPHNREIVGVAGDQFSFRPQFFDSA
jgi:hypothetical protein